MSYAPPPAEPELAGDERVVTIDLDDATPLDVLRAAAELRSAGCYDVEARVSSSGEGAHVKAWIGADAIDEAGVERLRIGAGDHAKRTELDREHRVKPPQILFTRKPDGEAGPWTTPVDAARELVARSERYPSTAPWWFDP